MNVFLILFCVSCVINIVALIYFIYDSKSKKDYNKYKLEYVDKLIELSKKEEIIKINEKNLSDKINSIENDYNLKFEKHCKEFDKKAKLIEEDLQINIKLVKDVLNGKKRIGVCKRSYTQTHGVRDESKTIVSVDIYIQELDRYKNGKSKIKITDINYTKIDGFSNLFNRKANEEYIQSSFPTLINTNEIEWLESVDEVQKEREKKFERITHILEEESKKEDDKSI